MTTGAQESSETHVGLARSPALSRWQPDAETLALGALMVLVLIAFRGVGGVGAEFSSELNGAEEIFFEPTGSSPALIFTLSGWLFARRWKRIRRLWARGARPVSSLLLLVPATALGLWAYTISAPSLLVPSAILSILGAALAGGGVPTLRTVSLPALFLLFAVPIPPLLLNQVMYPVQLATASTVGAAMNTLGLTSHVFAERIFFGGHVFQVIESCSGFRTLQTLLMTGVLYVEIFRGTRLRGVLLVLSTIPIAWFTNHLRIGTIVLNPLSHFSTVHTVQGVVMIVLGVFLIAATDWCMRGILPPGVPRTPRRLAPKSGRSYRLGVAIAAAALGLVAIASFRLDGFTPPAGHRSIAVFPPSHDGWTTEGLPLDRQFMGSFRFSHWLNRRYVKGGSEVELFAGTDEREWYGYSLLGTKHAAPGSGWEISRLKDGIHGALRFERFVARSAYGEQKLIIRWFRGVGSFSEEVWYTVAGFDRSSRGRTARAIVVRLSAAIPNGTSGLEQAESTLHKFLADFEAPIRDVLTVEH